MKRIICVVLLFALLFALCSCKEPCKYDEDWIIGKTSLEVEERYGNFLQAEMPRSSDGLYRSTRCHYFLKEEPMFFGDVEITLFSISFDENGVAWRCFTSLGPIGG